MKKKSVFVGVMAFVLFALTFLSFEQKAKAGGPVCTFSDGWVDGSNVTGGSCTSTGYGCYYGAYWSGKLIDPANIDDTHRSCYPVSMICTKDKGWVEVFETFPGDFNEYINNLYYNVDSSRIDSTENSCSKPKPAVTYKKPAYSKSSSNDEGDLRVYVRIYDKKGRLTSEKIKGIKVKLYRNGKKVETDKTNTKGEANFRDIESGDEYKVKCEMPGYVNMKEPNKGYYKTGRFKVKDDHRKDKECHLKRVK